LMARIHVTLSLDPDVVAMVKERGMNLSATVNDLLEQLLSGGKTSKDEEIERLTTQLRQTQERLWAAEQERIVAAGQVSRKLMIDELRKYWKRRPVTTPEQAQAWLENSAAKVGMTLEELKAELEREEEAR